MLRKPSDFHARHWGEVGAMPYGRLLEWLEENLNGQRGEDMAFDLFEYLHTALRKVREGRTWGAQAPFEALTLEESRRAAAWSYPVYAFGYNWLEDNNVAAQKLAERIDAVIARHNGGMSRCRQVILVTHSMGGLVARRCAQLPGLEDRIAGIVHGVMPAVGAPVAYRRCKVGLWEESPVASLVIGTNGQDVTAVFAQSPGALQLLPTERYPRPWFAVRDVHGADMPVAGLAGTDRPYQTLYAERLRWWGLVREEWLAPADGKAIDWNEYRSALQVAETFHKNLDLHYHPQTYAFYGTGIKSFEQVCWRMQVGSAARLGVREPMPGPEAVLALGHETVRMDGVNPEYVPGPPVARRQQGIRGVTVPSHHLELWLERAQDSGDGTVPVASGRAPLPYVRQLFAVPGIEHGSAFQHDLVRRLTAYSILRIAAQAPAPVAAASSRPSAAKG